MNNNIVASLGAGSGINVAQITRDLAAASRQPKVDRINQLVQKNQARISAVAQARSDLDGLVKSLSQMVSDGTLRSTPTVSNADVLTATAAPGFAGSDFSAGLEVEFIARAHSLSSGVATSRTDPIGLGGLTITMGGVPTSIAITASNNSLDGLAATINQAGGGVRASVVSDTGGFRLILRGPTGAANAFSVSLDAGSDQSLAAFAQGAGGGLSIAQSAQDALVRVDGVAFSRPTNSISDLVPGLTLTLKKASVGEIVDINATRPLAAIRQAANDFADVFNQVKASTSDAVRLTSNEIGLRQLDSELLGIANQRLTSHPTIYRLADIGISATRDGTFAVNKAKLEQALASDPEAVEALFNPVRSGGQTAITDPGLAGALESVRDRATSSNGALDRVTKALTDRQKILADSLAKVETREAAYAARLERQYSGLDQRVGALRATQAYLQQQIDIWSNNNS